MNDGTEAAADTKAKGGKKAAAKAQPALDGQIGRLLVRAIWAQEWAAAHPGATAEERKAAWKSERGDQMEQKLKAYRRALTVLQKAGVTLTLAPDAKDEADED